MSKNKSEILYGLHTVRHTLEQMPESIMEMFIQKDRKATKDIQKVLTLAKSAGVSIQHVSRETLDKQCGDAVHQGIVIKRRNSSNKQQLDLETLLADDERAFFILVLEGIQDPHNLGACLRTANAVGVDAVILPKDRSASINATVSKVASGAAESTPIITVGNIARTLRKLQEAGVWIVGTDVDVDKSLYDVDLSVSTAIIMGSEGKGLRQNTREHCDHL